MRTILRPAICVMDAAFRRRSERDGHVQRPDRKIAFHPVRDSPTDNPPCMQAEDYGEVQPSLTCPDMAEVTCPFLVRRISVEVPIRQVWRDVELVIAVGRDLMLTHSHS